MKLFSKKAMVSVATAAAVAAGSASVPAMAQTAVTTTKVEVAEQVVVTEYEFADGVSSAEMRDPKTGKFSPAKVTEWITVVTTIVTVLGTVITFVNNIQNTFKK